MSAFLLLLVLVQAPQSKPPAASIEGIVKTSGTGEPIYRARVMLSGGNNTPKTATTDRNGRFSFSDVDAGRYSLSAFANSYVRQFYGQKAANGPSTPVVLTAGQQMKDVVFEMTPTGVVTGRIYDFDNAPLPNADVVLQRLAYDASGKRTLQPEQQVRTNDLGEYRLFWVSPGKYFLRVEYTGGPTPVFRNPNDFMGPAEEGYAPIYYPGTTDSSSATEIEILPGGQLSAIDVTMIRTKTYSVRGRVIVTVASAAAGRPFVSLRPRQPSGTLMGINGTVPTINPADGTFEIRNVPAGSYILQANSGTPTSGMLRAERPLEVNQDLEGIVITLSPGFDLPGHVVFENGLPQAGTNSVPITSMRVMLRPAGDGGPGILSGVGGPPVLKPDGTFTITQVMPGTYQISILPLPPDSYVKAVTLGQTDALRDGFTVDRTPDSPIEILVGANAGKLEGSVVDREGKPLASTQVTLIPLEPNRADRYRLNVTDTTGHFTFRGVVPGEYKVFAWESMEANAYRDPEFIRRYDNQGKVVILTEGSNPSIELRVIKP